MGKGIVRKDEGMVDECASRIPSDQDKTGRGCALPPLATHHSPLATSLAWRIHPAGDRPLQALLVAAFVASTAALSGLVFRDLFLGALALLILSLSLTTYFLPTTFEVDEAEVRVRYPFSTRREPLAKFRSVVPDRNGLLLSPAREHRLAHELRSLFLIVPRARRDEVASFLEARIGRDAAPVK